MFGEWRGPLGRRQWQCGDGRGSTGSGPEAENCLQKVQTYQRILNYPKEFPTTFSRSISLSLSISISHSIYLSLVHTRTFCFSLSFFFLSICPSVCESMYTPNILFSASWQGQGSLFYTENILEVLSHPACCAALVSIVSISTPLRPTPTKTPAAAATFNHYLGIYIYNIIYVHVYFRA